MADEVALPPLEIAWRLASTTQPLVAGEPDQTSISLFVHEPDPKAVVGRPDDERLVYLKFVVSLSPASFPRENSKIVATFLGEGVPVFHVQLDLRVRRGAPAQRRRRAAHGCAAVAGGQRRRRPRRRSPSFPTR